MFYRKKANLSIIGKTTVYNTKKTLCPMVTSVRKIDQASLNKNSK